MRCHRRNYIYHKDGKGFVLCCTCRKIDLACCSRGPVSCQINVSELLQVVLNLCLVVSVLVLSAQTKNACNFHLNNQTCLVLIIARQLDVIYAPLHSLFFYLFFFLLMSL